MFTVDWFEKTGKKNFEKHLKRFSGMKVRFLEVGVYEGQSTVWLLQNIITEDSFIDVVDTFSGSIEHQDKEELKLETLKQRFLENIEPYKQRVFVHVGRSQDVLCDFKEKFDFIYIDGSHQAVDVIQDAILAFRILKINGLIAFDDYKWNRVGDPLQHPQIALDSFIQLFSNKIKIIEKNYQLFIEKLGD